MSAVNQVEINGVSYDINDKRINPVAQTEEMAADVGLGTDGKLYANVSGVANVSNITAGAKKAEIYTEGHLIELPLAYNSKMALYLTETETFGEKVASTDFILVSANSDIYISVEADAPTTTYNGTYVRIQFYNLDYSFNKNVWVRDDGNVNNMYTSAMKKFGYKLHVSQDMYIKVSKGNAKNVRLFAWDGKNFGIPVFASSKVTVGTDDGYAEELLPDTGGIGVVIPKDVDFLFVKDGYTITALFAVVPDSTASNHIAIVQLYHSNSLPAQFLKIDKTIKAQVGGVTKNQLYYLAKIRKDYDYDDRTYAKAHYMGDVSEFLSVYSDKNTSFLNPITNGTYALTNGAAVIKRANTINKIKWTCKKNVLAAKNSGEADRYFKKDVEYKGVPYASNWLRACFFGWHISPHTFINAANDPDSIFYNVNARSGLGGPYYGLVCSSYATLAAGFRYPQTNWGFMHDAHLQVMLNNTPQVGQLTTNGYGHCGVVGGIYRNPALSAVEFYECSTPVSAKRVYNSNILRYYNAAGGYSDYMHEYRYCVADFYNPRLSNFNYFPNEYNPDDITPTNGKARPYKGDRCVYTSDEEILINIKDTSANVLRYQQFDYNSSTGALTPHDNTVYNVDINGSSRVEIPQDYLINGGIYGVWLDDDAGIKEYFEYYDVSNLTVTVTQEGENIDIVVSDGEPWWYLFADFDTKMIGYNGWHYSDADNIGMAIPYTATGDYSDYGKRVTYNAGHYIFRKGVFGAYVFH